MRRMIALADLEAIGPPVRVRDVAALAGFSKAKVMADARAGQLHITWAQCGRRRMALVSRSEAHHYLQRLGIAA